MKRSTELLGTEVSGICILNLLSTGRLVEYVGLHDPDMTLKTRCDSSRPVSALCVKERGGASVPPFVTLAHCHRQVCIEQFHEATSSVHSHSHFGS